VTVRTLGASGILAAGVVGQLTASVIIDKWAGAHSDLDQPGDRAGGGGCRCVAGHPLSPWLQ
jgi:uncharacterized membrane protein YdcZ (DUF606 family)